MPENSSQPQAWDEIFHSALQRKPEERRAFVEQACASDLQLLGQVQALLEAHQNAQDFLDEPAFELEAKAVAADLPGQDGSKASSILAARTARKQIDFIAHYRIISKIGEGGMGEVYRATDTRLNREVAIKVLPEVFANDSDRMARFRREAQVLASLNHPNIAIIHGIEEDALVMELVEGPTLADRIAKGAIPIDQALVIAKQLAEALECAHERGIIHRDLKPENIKITADGRVKVLDFGLAKPLSDATGSPTASGNSTEMGVSKSGIIVGTPSYMAPEQACGDKVDRRVDIWAFGVVLYEMLTGRKLFGGSTSAVLRAVMTQEPDLEQIPLRARRLLRRCLVKDPKGRLRDIGDWAELLEEKAAHGSPSRFGKKFWLWAAPVIALAAIGYVALAWMRPVPAFRGPVFTRLTADFGLTTDPVLSPDGKFVAYASDRAGEGNLDIWIQQVAGGEAVRLTRDSADESEPSFSPDGSVIAFRSEGDGGGVYVVPSLGGDARRIADGGRRPRFSPDGSRIAYWTGQKTNYLRQPSKIYVVAATGGEPLAVQAGFAMAQTPVWSHDGRYLLFLGYPSPEQREFDWFTTPIEGGEAVATGAQALLKREGLAGWPDVLFTPAAWSGTDNVLLSATLGDSTNIWQVRVTPGGQAIGPPKRLTFGTGIEANPFQADEKLTFSTLSSDTDLWSQPTDTAKGKTTGVMERLTQDPAFDYYPLISFDGKTLAYMSTRSGKTDIWLRDMQTGRKTVAVAQVAFPQVPFFARDDSMLLFGGPQIGAPWYTLPLDAGTVSRPSARKILCENCWPVWDITTDRKWLLYDQETTKVMALRDLSSGNTVPFIRTQDKTIGRARISPNNRWVAFNASFKVFLVPLRFAGPADEPSWIPVAGSKDEQALHPQWSLDGEIIYYYSNRDGHYCIWARRVDPATGQLHGDAFPVVHLHDVRRSLAGISIPQFGMAVAADRIIFNLSDMVGNVWMAQTDAK